MGCCSPNKIIESEFVNNSSKLKNLSNDEVNSTIIKNENNIITNIGKTDKINIIDILSEKSNIKENNPIKLKQEKTKNKEESGFSLISSSERENTPAPLWVSMSVKALSFLQRELRISRRVRCFKISAWFPA